MVVLGTFFSAVLSFVFIVLVGASWWFLYEKMGEPGWKILIPFYSEYTLFKRVWKPWAYVWYFLASIIFFMSYMFCGIAISSYVGSGYTPDALTVPLGSAVSMAFIYISIALVFISWVATLAIFFVRNYKIAKCFGHGIGFSLGIAFMAPVFVPILAFGNSTYSNG